MLPRIAFRNNVTLNQMQFSADLCDPKSYLVSVANIVDVYGRYLSLAETLETLSVLYYFSDVIMQSAELVYGKKASLTFIMIL